MPNNFAVKVKGRGTSKNLKMGGLTLALKLYTTVDEPKSELHKGCPSCLNQIKMPNLCQNPECEKGKSGEPLDNADTVRIYLDGNTPVNIPKEETEALMLPPTKEFPEGIPLGNKDDIIVHSRLNEKEAYSMLSRSTNKYYLVPESNHSAGIYASLLHTMLTTKQALLVKFCLTSQRQHLGVIVEVDNQLALCELSFANTYRPLPVFELPKAISQDTLHAVQHGFLDFPTRPYVEAIDDYQIAFNYYLENKIKAEAVKRGETPKAKKDEALVELTLARPAPKVKAERSQRSTVTPARKSREVSMGKTKNGVEVPF